MTKPKKPKMPPSPTPHTAVVLAVDTAQRSGWAVYVCGELASSGEIDMLEPCRSKDMHGLSGWNADRVCLHALWEAASGRDWVAPYAEAVLVYERPFRGTTQGQWIGAWKQAWTAEGGHKRRMLGVYPATWRARVLDRGASRAPRDVVRSMEMRKAEAAAKHRVGPDEATAILIGRWASYAGEVGAVLPKRTARKKVA